MKGENKTYKYFGITSNKFTVRFRNHKHTFNNINLEKSTELSKFVWELKRKEKEFEIHWEILRQAQAYKPGNKFCNLCTSEAILIGFPAEDINLINSRDEIVSNCKHRSKWKLEKFSKF